MVILDPTYGAHVASRSRFCGSDYFAQIWICMCNRCSRKVGKWHSRRARKAVGIHNRRSSEATPPSDGSPPPARERMVTGAAAGQQEKHGTPGLRAATKPCYRTVQLTLVLQQSTKRRRFWQGPFQRYSGARHSTRWDGPDVPMRLRTLPPFVRSTPRSSR